MTEDASNINPITKKLIHVKPVFYSLCYFELKKIALKYGYNLLLNGSLNRDLDLVAIPWNKEIKDSTLMIQEFVEYLGGSIIRQSEGKLYGEMYHGRINYLINLNRNYDSNGNDLQYYLDISVTPAI